MGYDAVLFDNDGVLLRYVDTKDGFEPEVRRLFRRFGVSNPTLADVRSFLDLHGIEQKQEVCDRYGLDLDRVWAAREDRYLEHQRSVLKRGIKDLYPDFNAIQLLFDAHDLGVVSNNHDGFVGFALDYFDISYLFETSYGREPTVQGIRRTKPDTYYLRQALQDLGTRNALYVGDSQVDVEAAQSLGIDVAFLRREHREDYELTAEPTYEFKGLHGLLDVV